MTAVAHARSPITNGLLDIGGHPVGLLAERAGAIHRRESRGRTFRVPRSATSWRPFVPRRSSPPDTAGTVGVDRRPPGLYDRSGEST
jgi:hypothetical protein